MESQSKSCFEVSTSEILAAELIASGWTRDTVHASSVRISGQDFRDEVIDEMSQSFRLELLSRLNLYRVSASLDDIRMRALSAGAYDAAALATVRLADLLLSAPKP
ncbi:TPA: hypothetical protein QH731_003565 [Klebsiella variicola]|nr:hypothetical protein [Klebsiella variicola]